MLKKELEQLKNNSPLKNYVIDYILDDYDSDEEIRCFFYDIFNYGCISGMVGSLIYYDDTHKFFDDYYDEIQELLEQYQDEYGEYLKPKGDMKNFYAWFAFEQTCQNLINELELEIEI